MSRHAQGAPAPARSSLPAPRHLPSVVREPLAAGDRVRTLHAGRTGSVMKVYSDGSACVTWDDKPAPFGLVQQGEVLLFEFHHAAVIWYGGLLYGGDLDRTATRSPATGVTHGAR